MRTSILFGRDVHPSITGGYHMHTIKNLGLLTVVVILTACAQASAIRFDTVQRFPVRAPGSQVAMYADEKPTCAYVEIGSVRSEGGDFVSPKAIRTALVSHAQQMGGDAVVGVGQGTRVVGATYSVAGPVNTTLTTLQGTVVHFTDPSCTK